MKELDKLFQSEKYTKELTKDEFEQIMIETNNEIPISDIDFSTVQIEML